MTTLSDIRVVLVEPQSPGNIGSVARVMKNMRVKKLTLVNPRTPLTEEAYHLACGADDLLNSAHVTPSMEEALSGVRLAVGTSSRRVSWIPTALRPAELAQGLVDLSPGWEVGLVFGPERTGLTNEHLRLCQWLVTIPSDPIFESLNLSHAVAIVLYEVFQKLSSSEIGRNLQLAPYEKVEEFHRQLEEWLLEIGFLSADNPKLIMSTLRQVFGRAGLEERDVQILRGILRQSKWYATQRNQKP
ncbi:MAG: RNA methyltransferase [Acidobacteriota bacterium]